MIVTPLTKGRQACDNSTPTDGPVLPALRSLPKRRCEVSVAWTADVHTRFLRKLSDCSRRPAFRVQKSHYELFFAECELLHTRDHRRLFEYGWALRKRG